MQTAPKITKQSAIGRIAARFRHIGGPAIKRTYRGDIIEIVIRKYHLNVCPLRLTDLARADDFNLVHDVVGILQGKECFTPRFHA